MTKRRPAQPDRALTVLFLAFAVVVAILPVCGALGVIAMSADSIRALSGLAVGIALFGLFAPERLKHWLAEIIGRLPP